MIMILLTSNKIITNNFLYLEYQLILIWKWSQKDKKIKALDGLDKEDKEKQTRFVKDIIVNAYSTEKINELHYTLLREKISKYE